VWLDVVFIRRTAEEQPPDPAWIAMSALMIGITLLMVYASIKNRRVSLDEDGVTFWTFRGWQRVPWARFRSVERTAVGILIQDQDGNKVSFPVTLYADLDSLESYVRGHIQAT
jgi:hypothetical protein